MIESVALLTFFLGTQINNNKKCIISIVFINLKALSTQKKYQTVIWNQKFRLL